MTARCVSRHFADIHGPFTTKLGIIAGQLAVRLHMIGISQSSLRHNRYRNYDRTDPVGVSDREIYHTGWACTCRLTAVRESDTRRSGHHAYH